MKVLLVANYAKEHINKFHLSTIKRFKELGWMVDVACRADAEVPFCDHLFDLPLARNPFHWQMLVAIRKLKMILRDGAYDVIHVHTFTGKVVGILAARQFRRAGLKVIYTSHGFQYYRGAPWLNWCFLPLDKWLMTNVDILITINREDYQNAQRFHFAPHRIFYCHGAGVNLDRFQATAKSRETVRKELGISLSAPVLIYVAELTRNKNQMLLLRMFERVVQKFPDAQMLLVGPDHFGGEIQKQIRRMNQESRIHCLGWRSDIPDLLKAADIGVASSIREGFGINIVEYMASGLPVVAVDNRGHRETIENGVTGYLVPQSDDGAMAQRVEELMGSLEMRIALARNASAHLERYKEETIVSKLVEIYQSCL